jgi:hypothetical protein
MPRLIQTPPVGLLSALTSKDGGVGPNALLDEVQGGVDLMPFYLLNFRRSRTRTLTKATINGSTTGPEGWNYFSLLAGPTAADLTVPANQLWHLLSVSLHLATVVGSVNVQAAFTTRDPNLGSAGYGFPIGNSTGAVAAGTTGISGGPVDMWVGPGSTAAFFIRDWLLATNDCDVLMSVDYEVIEF